MVTPDQIGAARSPTSVTRLHVVADCCDLYGVVACGFHETSLFRRGVKAQSGTRAPKLKL